MNGGYSKETLILQLLRSPFFITAHNKCPIEAVHYPGIDNTHADALSCNTFYQFSQDLNTMDQHPTGTPRSTSEQ